MSLPPRRPRPMVTAILVQPQTSSLAPWPSPPSSLRWRAGDVSSHVADVRVGGCGQRMSRAALNAPRRAWFEWLNSYLSGRSVGVVRHHRVDGPPFSERRRDRRQPALLILRASRRGATLQVGDRPIKEGRANAEWRRATPAGPLGGADLLSAARHVLFGSVRSQPAGTQQAFLSGTVSSSLGSPKEEAFFFSWAGR